jgi:MinD-like ATPase involved in chromosome partitioning or flagellar assembly
MQIAKILAGVPLFAALEDDELEKIAALTSVKGYLAGTPLFQTGQPSDCFYVIARGRVKIRLPAVAGTAERDISLGGGKFFGEMGVISGTPRNADAEVEEDAVLVRIDQSTFDQLMAVDERISEKVMAAYMVRASETEERVEKAEKALADPKSLLFFSAGGGAGASFLVANTALKIRDLTCKKVLVLDLDLQSPSQHLYLGVGDGEGSLADLLARGKFDAAALQEAARELHFGIDFLGGPKTPRPEHCPPERIEWLVELALKAYDYVLIDTTSALTKANEALFKVADSVHLVFGPDIVSVSRAVPIFRWFSSEQMDRKVRLVMNKYARDEGFSPGAVEERFSRPVLGRVEFDGPLAIGSVNEGVPLVKRNPRSITAADLNRFARQVVSLQAGVPQGERPFSIWNLLSG